MITSRFPAGDTESAALLLGVVKRSLRSPVGMSEPRVAGLSSVMRAGRRAAIGVPIRSRKPASVLPEVPDGGSLAPAANRRDALARILLPGRNRRLVTGSSTSARAPGEPTSVPSSATQPPALHAALQRGMVEVSAGPSAATPRGQLQPGIVPLARIIGTLPATGGLPRIFPLLEKQVTSPRASAMPRTVQPQRSAEAGTSAEGRSVLRSAFAGAMAPIAEGNPSRRTSEDPDSGRSFGVPQMAASGSRKPEAPTSRRLPRTAADWSEAIAATTRRMSAPLNVTGVPRRVASPGSDGPALAARAGVGAVSGSRRSEAATFRLPGASAPQSSDNPRDMHGASQADTMIALTGHIVIDGRKLGRIAASSQVSSASLPPRSGSAVNIKALPIFTGSSVPL